MNKRQYIFLWLMIILLYLSFKILQFEYKKYTIAGYIKQQELTIKNLKTYLKETKKTLNYINTKAFKNKVLKSENWMKMKWEEVIVLTPEKVYKKFSWKNLVKNEWIQIEEKKYNITSWMTNFQKWIYFLFKKDVR